MEYQTIWRDFFAAGAIIALVLMLLEPYLRPPKE